MFLSFTVNKASQIKQKLQVQKTQKITKKKINKPGITNIIKSIKSSHAVIIETVFLDILILDI